MKYYLRSISRATPFGLFSSIGLPIKTTNETVFIDIDSNWLFEFIKEISWKDILDKKSLIFIRSSNVIFEEKQFSIFRENTKYASSLVPPEAMSTFLINIKKGFTYGEMEQQINALVGKRVLEADLGEVIDYLLELDLIDWSFGHGTHNLYNYQILKFMKNNTYKSKFQTRKIKKIIEIIEIINDKGFNFDLYEELLKSLSSVQESSSYTNVVSYSNKDYNLKNKGAIKKAIEIMHEELMQISEIVFKENSLNAIITFILEKYGENTLLPLNEIFELLKKSKKSKNNEGNINKKFTNIINSIIQKSIIKNEKFDLRKHGFIEKVIQEFEIQNRVSEITTSDLIFDVLIDEDNAVKLLKISQQIGANKAGKLLGRFTHNEIVNSKQNYFINLLDSIYKQNGKKLAKISSDFQDKKIHNVTNRLSNEINTEIIFNGNISNKNMNIIHIEDIYIYIQNKRIHLYNREKNETIVVYNTHSVNHELVNDFYKLLEDLSYESTLVEVINYIRQVLINLECRTNVYYGEILIYVPSMYIKLYSNNYTKKEVYEYVLKKCKEREIDYKDFVKFYSNGEGMLIDLRNTDQLNIIVSELFSGKTVLIEKPDKDVIIAIYNNEKFINAEMVVSFFEESDQKNNDSSNLVEYFDAFKPAINNEMIYFKLWVDKRFETIFLCNYLYPIILNLREKNILLDFFFVKYEEYNRNIIRLRVYGEDIGLLLNKVSEFLNNTLYVKEYEISPYYKEISRYTPYGIKKFEKHSCNESNIVLEILSSKKYKREFIFYYFITKLILQLNFEEIFSKEYSLLNLEDRKLRTSFQSKKRNAIRILLSFKKDDYLNSLYSKWSSVMLDYLGCLNDGREITFFDLVHMFFNRLYGVNPIKEKSFMINISVLLVTLKYTRK